MRKTCLRFWGCARLAVFRGRTAGFGRGLAGDCLASGCWGIRHMSQQEDTGSFNPAAYCALLYFEWLGFRCAVPLPGLSGCLLFEICPTVWPFLLSYRQMNYYLSSPEFVRTASWQLLELLSYWNSRELGSIGGFEHGCCLFLSCRLGRTRQSHLD